MLDILILLGQIGPILSGIGLLFAAYIAHTVFRKVHRKQLVDSWVDRFRVLYGEFWNSEVMAEVRELIANDPSYEKLEVLLEKRNSQQACKVLSEEYMQLDKIDRFCSLMIRLKSFSNDKDMSNQQKTLVNNVLYNYWIEKIRSRKELSQYVQNNWASLVIDD